jgi:iron complex outermembrane recepter protein
MSSNLKVRSAVRIGLGLGAGVFASMALAPAAMAQAPQTGGQQAAVIDEITVTGSRIRRADLESPSPVTVIQRDEITLTGLTDVGSFIQRMPSMSGSPIGTTTNNGGNGSVLIDLRGLGPDRTLTLVNGHRVVDGGDFQTIAPTMIERVEILKDGASAVYGADAVAGVVNIITRRDFEGLQFDAQTSDHFDMDSGRQTSFGMIAGTNFTTTHGSGNFVFGGEYVKQEEAYQSDAPWAFFQNSYYIYPAGCERQVTAPYDGTPEGGCYVLGSSSIPGTRVQFGTTEFPVGGRGTPITYSNPDGSGLVPGWTPYNYAPVNYIQTPYERVNLFAEGHFDVTPSVRFNTALRANFRESAQELAPLPYFSSSDPGYQERVTVWDVLEQDYVEKTFNTVSRDNYYFLQAMAAAGLVPGVDVVAEAPTDLRRRFEETTRRFEQEINQFQAVFGFEGQFRDMDWEVSYNKGYRSRTDVDRGQFFGPNLTNAMGPSGLDADGVLRCFQDINDLDSVIPGCVPMNFFGGPMSVTQEMLDYVAVDLVDKFQTEQDILGASITGSAFELPGGPLGWAAGAGYWGQKFNYTPDSAKALDAVTGNTGVGTDGSLHSTSVFAEFLAPVFDNGAQAIDLRAGLRWDDFNIFGSETTWQFGAEFRLTQALKLRGTAGTVFRAPTIGDLFAGQVDSFPTFVDPCSTTPLPAACLQGSPPEEIQARARIGGNPFLQPETGDTFTVGAVWTPEVGNGNLSLTLDYWKINIDDAISSLGVQFILDDCYLAGNPSSCALVTRRPADYGIQQILDGPLNVAEQGAEGIDFEVRYAWDTDFGQFTASLLWAHMLERTKTAFPGATKEDLSGRYTDPTAQDGGAYPEDKISYSLQWARGDLSVAYLGEFISSLDADTFFDPDYIQKIDSQLYHDIVVSYEIQQTNTRIAASITNITDEAPPFIEVGFNATTDPATYRMFGRGYWVRLEQRF